MNRVSWFSELADLYDENRDLIGKRDIKSTETRFVSLLPISHTAVNVGIQVDLDKDGNFVAARALVRDKECNEQKTIIPTTVDSTSRSSGISPMPVDDKLKYVARDYYKYSNKEKDKKYFEAYLNQLKAFLNYLKRKGSREGLASVSAIYKYVSTQDLLKDLVEKQHLFGKNQMGYSIPKSFKGKEKPAVYKYSVGSPLESFVRFKVTLPNQQNDRWENPVIFKDWINYYYEVVAKDSNGLDYISGEEGTPLTQKHLKGILPMESNAKLISANDTSNYTYRGRFLDASEVVGLSYEKSQKAQLALKWLIERQGFSIDSREYLAWGYKGQDVSVGFQSNDSVVENNFNQANLWNTLSTSGLDTKAETPVTNSLLANRVRDALIKGKDDFASMSPNNVYIMELDAPVPGRIDIVYYQSMTIQSYIDKFAKWFETTSIYINNYDNEYKDVHYSLPMYAKLMYGANANPTLIKNTVSELSHVILNSQIVPENMLRAIFNKAIRPVNFKSSEKIFTWKRTLGAAAKLFKTQYPKEFGPLLDPATTDRAYLFGRLLALADIAEKDTYSEQERKARVTTAARYMAKMAEQPLETWRKIYVLLQPYLAKNKYSSQFEKAMNIILSKLELSGPNLNKPLFGNGKFLIGYIQQQESWYHKYKDKEERPIDSIINNLDVETHERSYLYGRLLAVADSLEERILKSNNVSRTTNAKRSMSSFVKQPLTTWKALYLRLQPYLQKDKFTNFTDSLLLKIMNKFSHKDYEKLNDPLNANFILGYSHQKVSTTMDEKSDDNLSKSLDRSYLYGRLLSIANELEKNVLANHHIDRPTNASKYMSSFAVRPASTWKVILLHIQPYFKKSSYGIPCQRMIEKISEELGNTADKPLDERFLIGYANQTMSWSQLKGEKKEKKNDTK